MLLSRILKKNKRLNDDEVIAELRIHPLINKMFEYFMKIDLALIRMGINLPVGGSRLLVARKIEKKQVNNSI